MNLFTTYVHILQCANFEMKLRQSMVNMLQGNWAVLADHKFQISKSRANPVLVLSLFHFGLCLPISSKQSPNTQIVICRLDTTGLVVVLVLDWMSCFCPIILNLAKILQKYSHFCRNMTISAFLLNPVFVPESLFRQVNQNIRPNYSAESLLCPTLLRILVNVTVYQGIFCHTYQNVTLSSLTEGYLDLGWYPPKWICKEYWFTENVTHDWMIGKWYCCFKSNKYKTKYANLAQKNVTLTRIL